MCTIAIQQNVNKSYVIRYVKNQTDEVCLLAIDCCGIEALRYIKNLDFVCRYVVQFSEQFWMIELSKNGHLIDSMPNPTEEMCLTAIRNNPNALSIVYYPSFQVCIEACLTYNSLVRFIGDLSIKSQVELLLL